MLITIQNLESAWMAITGSSTKKGMLTFIVPSPFTETTFPSNIHSVVFIVNGDKGFVSSGKGDLITAIIPPVSDRLTIGHVSEFSHVVNLSPTVLTDPSVSASVITFIRFRIKNKLIFFSSFRLSFDFFFGKLKWKNKIISV
ncbi:hypothetical protein BpHYR1_047464 [Brachionus plicatilis]|uniref:Uncharacterized protein n=1 Tax=Brachionus plicatilis TaxID=10195 RepID=A0A3M7QNS1_BRAPC|nr:hypothetical protein BpHYR1_047464 [Brachionus plicatilis]